MRFSQSLFREVRPEFLKLLAVKSTPLLLDIAASLEEALRVQPQGLEREEVVAIAERWVEDSSLDGEGSFDDDGDESASVATTPREKARILIERLCTAGWLERIEQSNFRDLFSLQSPASMMLKALRDIAAVDDAIFSDKISGVCATLTSPTVMKTEPWAAVLRSIAQAEEGLAELRGMGRSIERHTRRQLEAATLKENLQELFDNFAGGSSGRCYSELVRAHLHTRLTPARRVLEDLHLDDVKLDMMRAELLRRESTNLSPEAAMLVVREKTEYLESLLMMVLPLTERIDQRAAEFTRRSYARFRYLQESSGDRRGKVKDFFECINRLGAGLRANELEQRLSSPIPSLLLAEVRLMDARSLARARRTLPSAEIEPIGEELGTEASTVSLEDFAKQLRAALTVSRANRFVASLPGPEGSRHHISELTLAGEERMGSLIACLLHANSRHARYGIEITRIATDSDGFIWYSVPDDDAAIEDLEIVKGMTK